MAKKNRKLSRREAGRLGGMATKKRHGVAHYRAAGAKGFMATVARHWAGDKSGYLRWLHAHAWIQDLDRAFRASGAACIEIPPIPGLDDDDDDAEVLPP